MEDIIKLTVVNECLKCMSEAPLNTLVNEDHPFIASALSSLDLVMLRELSTPWWFNSEFATLHPDAVTKRISLPQNCLDIDPRAGGSVTARGRWLYNLHTQSYEFDSAQSVSYVAFVPFEDLPIIFKVYVMYAAVLDFCSGFDADAQRVNEIQTKYAMSRSIVKAADTRNKAVNMFDSVGVAQKLNGVAWPGSMGVSRARNAYRR